MPENDDRPPLANGRGYGSENQPGRTRSYLAGDDGHTRDRALFFAGSVAGRHVASLLPARHGHDDRKLRMPMDNGTPAGLPEDADVRGQLR